MIFQDNKGQALDMLLHIVEEFEGSEGNTEDEYNTEEDDEPSEASEELAHSGLPELTVFQDHFYVSEEADSEMLMQHARQQY